MNQTTSVAIIGAGPAGLAAAIAAAAQGADVIILEKNKNPGKKLLITGSGQCNITHQAEIPDFLERLGPVSAQRFIRTALYHFSPRDTLQFFTQHGTPLLTRSDGKVFPASLKAQDILNGMLAAAKEFGVTILLNHEVTGIQKTGNSYEIISETAASIDPAASQESKRNLIVKTTATAVIIATGGKSYPSTGSTGDGYTLAEKLGHAIIPPKPALTDIISDSIPFSDIAGLSLIQAHLFLVRNGKRIHSGIGDILFTHKGLSGPGVRDNSRYMQPGDIIQIDLTRTHNETRSLLLEAVQNFPKRSLERLLYEETAIPKRIIPILLNQLNLESKKTGAEVSKKVLNAIIETTTKFPVTISRLGDFSTAMVTAGGIALPEVYAKTMESRKSAGLFFSGEVLDIDGDTGGYNLQAALSTGFLAGESAGAYIKTLE